MRKLLLHEDSKPVLSVNAIISAFEHMISELRKLHRLLQDNGIHIDAKWVLSAVNKFADSLSRTWDPSDVSV